MQIQSSRTGNTAHAALAGELDHHAAPAVREGLDALLEPGIKNLVLDMAGLTLMDSSGIGVLIGRYKQVQARGGSITVKNPSPQIDAIMRMAGLYNLLRRG